MIRNFQSYQSEHSQQHWSEVYEQCFGDVLSFVLSYVKSRDVAEDITQELFLRLIQKGCFHVKAGNIRPYLFISAKNAALNYLKKASKDIETRESLCKHYASLHYSLEDELEDAEYQELLRQYLDKLSLRSRMVFKMCREEGKTYEEVAGKLQISANAVKKHMVKSMRSIRLMLKNDLGLFSLFLSFFSGFYIH